MPKKIIYLLIIFLLVVSASSISSRDINTIHFNENNIINEEVIIDMIEQLNESLYLGYLEDIVSFGARYTGTENCYEAGTYIYNEFSNMSLDVKYHNWIFGGLQDRNIEATLHGINNNSDEIYIICAHYDTVQRCPGADDDGSGVAALLSIAYIMEKYNFNHTIRFIAFSGEEQWMYGSREYAREAYENGDNIIAVLNVDMIGFAVTPTHFKYINLYKNEPSIWISDLIISLSQTYYDYILLDVISLGQAPSDHVYFWHYGYDGVFYQEYEFNYFYHTPNDIIKKLNISYASRCSKLVLTTLAELASSHAQNSPPDTPKISGPNSGKINEEYNYIIVTTEPENNDVSYYIDWGDGSINDWTMMKSSGEEYNVSHIWNEEGRYIVKVKAKDIYEYESDWASTEVNMPKNKVIFSQIFEQLLSKFFFLKNVL
jgi:hypothetical protein